MHNEHFIPKVADRQQRELWEQSAEEDTFTRCHDIVAEVLETHQPAGVDAQIVKDIRSKFNNFVQ